MPRKPQKPREQKIAEEFFLVKKKKLLLKKPKSLSLKNLVLKVRNQNKVVKLAVSELKLKKKLNTNQKKSH